VTTARAPTASADTSVTHSTVPASCCSSNAEPLSVSTNAIGTRNAGSVYFHVCHIVLITEPPVMAAAATAASAVGGVTSDSTA
jgi:hypothetical protein